MNNILGQFSRGEFFSVIPSGFYIFLVTYSCVAFDLIEKPKEQTVLKIFQSLSNHIYQQPVSLIFILFACYMLGSVFRTLPVYWAEKSIPPFSTDFPSPVVLKEVMETLNNNQNITKHDISKMPSIKDGVPRHVYNYWKDVLCVNSSEGFQYYQTFETRVRLFSGIIWASWSGILGGLYIILREREITSSVGLPILLISLVLLITFGSNFSRVRRQESRALLLIFSAYLQK